MNRFTADRRPEQHFYNTVTRNTVVFMHRSDDPLKTEGKPAHETITVFLTHHSSLVSLSVLFVTPQLVWNSRP